MFSCNQQPRDPETSEELRKDKYKGTLRHIINRVLKNQGYREHLK